MGVRTHDRGSRTLHRGVGPGVGAAVGVAALAFVLLVASGRPLSTSPDAGAAGVLLGLALAVSGLVFDLDPTGRAVVGKMLAALFAAAAAGMLFAAVARRHTLGAARVAGIVLAVGTSLFSAALSWSGEAPATAAVAVALWLLVRGDSEDDPRIAAPAAIPLAAAVVLEPSCWALALVTAAAVFVRFPRAAARLLLWTAPGVAVAAAFVLGANAHPGAAGDAALGPLALLVSPARGALVFTPVALVALAGAVSALRVGHRIWDAPRASRWLPLTALLAGLTHLAWVAVRGEAGGPSWGPRHFAPAWPLLLLFLPEGIGLLRLVGSGLVVLSVAVQALGAFAWDGRWDLLYGPGGVSPRSPWSVLRSPVAFQLRERVARPALVAVEGGRLVVREHPLALGGPTGSRVSFDGERPGVFGADATLGNVILEGAARAVEGRLRLEAPGDALFFRVREEARPRRLELRVRGRGNGTLVVEEKTFRTAARRQERPALGSFRARLPYVYAESGGGDVRLRAAGGSLEIESVALVPPSEPEDVVRLP